MDVRRLLNGIAVIIDDEIFDTESKISVIKRMLESRNIPVVVYNDVPQHETVSALMNASFIILDWDLMENALSISSDERVIIADTLRETLEDNLISFIKALQSAFVPLFIFTNVYPETIKDKLRASDLWADERPNRIFIKSKDEIKTGDELFHSIEEWLIAMPSAYVFKEWQRKVFDTINNTFVELYNYSPYWTKIIWDLLKKDTREYQTEFGDFITKSLVNRIGGFLFDESVIDSDVTIHPKELQQVIQGERYLKYETQPAQAYTGDLFKDGSKYYLNVRAQCDISRNDSGKLYNPVLYCIEGKKLRDRDITTDEIELTSKEQIVFGPNKSYSLSDLHEISHDDEKLSAFNKNFSSFRNKVFFQKGTFLERSDKVIVGCIAGEDAIQFDLDLSLKYYEDNKEKRIGRVLPPYITRIQQKCSQYMIREGVLPIPDELVNDFMQMSSRIWFFPTMVDFCVTTWYTGSQGGAASYGGIIGAS